MKHLKVLKFEELSEDAKKFSIEVERERRRENDCGEALRWAIDDCALFEPKDEEMTSLLGGSYYSENKTSDEEYGRFMFKNNRKGIFFNGDIRGQLNITKALEVTNDVYLKKWLNIPDNYDLSYKIKTVKDITVLKIKLESTNEAEDKISKIKKTLIKAEAKRKFNNLICEIWDRIENGIEHIFGEEEAIERLTEEDRYFLKNGFTFPIECYEDVVEKENK